MRTLDIALTVGLLALASCGGQSGSDVTSDSVGTEPKSAATADTTAPPVFDISDAEPSVVKIAAEGTFIDPEVGEQRNSAGVGSGVVVSDDGLVITNNHVVTGAALLRVTVPGLEDPVNARVLGVSECSDLAVIQMEGDGYSALQYRTDNVAAGLDVYAAGYPASDANTIDEVDYTLTRGIISSTSADGETSWASVDEVVEHDARIRGGNSGGPLLDDSGRIVGINYAGIDESDQNYAISATDAVTSSTSWQPATTSTRSASTARRSTTVKPSAASGWPASTADPRPTPPASKPATSSPDSKVSIWRWTGR